MSIEKVREEFETWFRANHCWAPEHDPLVRDVDGEYIMLRTHDRWRAWQASRDALVVELPTQSEGNRPYNQGIYDTKIAIEAAGVKVKP